MTTQKQKLAGAVLTRTGGMRASLVGLAATLALVVGYFLPLTALSPLVSDSLGFDTSIVTRSAARAHDGRLVDLSGRLERGDAISGRDWAAVLDAVEDQGGLDERGRRTVGVARFGLVLLPFAAAGLALLLLLRSVPPGRAVKLGLGPVAAALAVAQTRFASSLILVLTMALSLIVFALTTLLWVGARHMGEHESSTGAGILLMAVGGGIAFLSGFLSYGPGRLRAVLWSVVLIGAFGVFAAVRVSSG